MKFSEFGLSDQLLEALDYMGFKDATPIQELSIPIIKEGKDIIACAQTGTGKTAAFILPVLDAFAGKELESITTTLVLCPTRELAIQIDRQIQGFAYFLGVESIPVYGGGGGAEFEQQKKALTGGTHIIVATPGKLISHLNLGYVKFDKVQHLILDEADRMLDMGFHEDLKKIMSFLPKKRQNLMFSATMPPKIRQLAKQTLVNPHEVNIALSKPAEGVLQAVYLVYNQNKNRLINKLINEKDNYESIIIFTSTKAKVNDIVSSLRRYKHNVEGISSDYDQSQREEVLRTFRSKQTRIVVATDVLARGIDIKDINLVINYEVPKNAEDYVHRVGRTARANTTGVALTLVNEEDMYQFSQIEKLIETTISKIPTPKEIGESPEWSLTKSRGPKKHFNNNRKGGGSKGGNKGGKKPYYKKKRKPD